jgi:hypothetical protein
MQFNIKTVDINTLSYSISNDGRNGMFRINLSSDVHIAKQTLRMFIKSNMNFTEYLRACIRTSINNFEQINLATLIECLNRIADSKSETATFYIKCNNKKEPDGLYSMIFSDYFGGHRRYVESSDDIIAMYNKLIIPKNIHII